MRATSRVRLPFATKRATEAGPAVVILMEPLLVTTVVATMGLATTFVVGSVRIPAEVVGLVRTPVRPLETILVVMTTLVRKLRGRLETTAAEKILVANL